jgi:ribosomal-protein-alanine N-acetyltransferase
MSETHFLTINTYQPLPNELSSKLFELDRLFFPTPWTLSAWNSLHEQDRLLVILSSESSIVGFCLFDKSIADSFAHLLKILVHPDWRNRGLAKKLLNSALDQLKNEGCTQLFLEVEEDNCAAKELYSLLGFKVVHRKKDFYGTGRAALIMTKEQ